MLYVPGAALFGTVMVATNGTVDPELTTIGLGGVKTQFAPGSELTLQVAVMLPA
jgi:hypothetical protein